MDLWRRLLLSWRRPLPSSFTVHSGGTNSGKTHSALQKLARASSGLYCAPLRLMALQVGEQLDADPHVVHGCAIVTGQFSRRPPRSRHTAATVEMAPLRPVHTLLLDEAQLAADASRGSAFTRAMLAVPAASISVTGPTAVEGMVGRVLAAAARVTDPGENSHVPQVTVQRHKRLSRLTVEPDPPDCVQPGDAVVCFGRRAVLRWRQRLERDGWTVACVYGAMPPEMRVEQARRFNEHEADVLIATDAIALGLNFRIRRVVLAEGDKFDGVDRRPLTVSEIKQVAGRAGRFGHAEEGFVTALDRADLEAVRRAMKAEEPSIDRAGLFPDAALVKDYLRCQKRRLEQPFSEMLDGMVTVMERELRASSDPSADAFFVCDGSSIVTAAALIDDVGSGLDSVDDRLTWAMAPLDSTNVAEAVPFQRWCRQFASGRPVRLRTGLKRALADARSSSNSNSTKSHNESSDDELAALETLHKSMDVYRWLGQRFGRRRFPDIDRACKHQDTLIGTMSSLL